MPSGASYAPGRSNPHNTHNTHAQPVQLQPWVSGEGDMFPGADPNHSVHSHTVQNHPVQNHPVQHSGHHLGMAPAPRMFVEVRVFVFMTIVATFVWCLLGMLIMTLSRGNADNDVVSWEC